MIVALVYYQLSLWFVSNILFFCDDLFLNILCVAFLLVVHQLSRKHCVFYCHSVGVAVSRIGKKSRVLAMMMMMMFLVCVMLLCGFFKNHKSVRRRFFFFIFFFFFSKRVFLFRNFNFVANFNIFIMLSGM